MGPLSLAVRFFGRRKCASEGLAPYKRRNNYFADGNSPGEENVMKEAGQLSSAPEGPAGLENVT